MKNTTHPMDIMANWFSHGGWFDTLAKKYITWEMCIGLKKNSKLSNGIKV
jgi:hypothetical protein